MDFVCFIGTAPRISIIAYGPPCWQNLSLRGHLCSSPSRSIRPVIRRESRVHGLPRMQPHYRQHYEAHEGILLRRLPPRAPRRATPLIARQRVACSRVQRLSQLAQIVRRLRRMAKNPTDAIMKSSFRASVKVARVRAMAAQVILISVTLGFSGDSRTHGADLKFRPSQPPLAKSGPIELQDVDRACREWTNGCRVCERTANGEFNCSNIGIACQPTGGRCSRR